MTWGQGIPDIELYSVHENFGISGNVESRTSDETGVAPVTKQENLTGPDLGSGPSSSVHS